MEKDEKATRYDRAPCECSSLTAVRKLQILHFHDESYLLLRRLCCSPGVQRAQNWEKVEKVENVKGPPFSIYVMWSSSGRQSDGHSMLSDGITTIKKHQVKQWITNGVGRCGRAPASSSKDVSGKYSEGSIGSTQAYSSERKINMNTCNMYTVFDTQNEEGWIHWATKISNKANPHYKW